MAIQVINDPNRDFASSLANAIGGGLGSGLQSGIASLAQLKIEDLATQKQFERQQKQAAQLRQQESQALQQLGLPEALSSSISGISDPSLRRTLLGNVAPELFQTPQSKFQSQKISIEQQKAANQSLFNQRKLDLEERKANAKSESEKAKIDSALQRLQVRETGLNRRADQQMERLLLKEQGLDRRTIRALENTQQQNILKQNQKTNDVLNAELRESSLKLNH